MKYYFVCTRGTDNRTFASVHNRFNPMLEMFAVSEGDSVTEAYNTWAKSHEVNFKVSKVTALAGVQFPAWELELEYITKEN